MRLRPRTIAILGAAGAAAVVACTWIDPLDDVAQPRAGDGGATDGSAADADGAAADRSAEGATTAWCLTQDATFCDDFDEDTPLPGPRWTDKRIAQGALTRARRADAPSAPNVLVGSVNVTDPNSAIKAILYKDFDVAPDEIHLEHDFRMDSPPSDGGVKLSAIALDGYEIELQLGNDTVGVKECYATTPCVDPPRATLPTSSSWHRARIDLSTGKDGGPGSIKLWVDGNLLHERAPGLTGDAAAELAQGKLRLSVGVFYAGSTDPIEFAFDDVVLSYR